MVLRGTERSGFARCEVRKKIKTCNKKEEKGTLIDRNMLHFNVGTLFIVWYCAKAAPDIVPFVTTNLIPIFKTYR